MNCKHLENGCGTKTKKYGGVPVCKRQAYRRLNLSYGELAYLVKEKCVEYAFSDAAKGTWFYQQSDLTGMCAIASAVLKRIYDIFDIRSKVVQGTFRIIDLEENDELCQTDDINLNYHCYNIVETSQDKSPRIVDITAEQFLGDWLDKGILETELDSNYYPEAHFLAWKSPARFRYKDFSSWVDGQKPTPAVINQITRSVLHEIEHKYQLKYD